MKRTGDRFADHFGNPPTDEALTRFRSLAKETLGADDAVFPTQASFTLSHRRMITGDISDNGSGDFLATLLTAGAPAETHPAADLMKQLLDTDTDPWTMIGWPLLGLGDEKEAPMGPGAQVRADGPLRCSPRTRRASSHPAPSENCAAAMTNSRNTRQRSEPSSRRCDVCSCSALSSSTST